MLNLIATTDDLSLTRSGVADIDVQCSGVDVDTATGAVFTPWKQNSAFSSAATANIVTHPGTAVYRNVKFISCRNKHASASNVITVNFDANGTLYELMKVTLLAGEALVMREGTWFHFDANSGVYGGIIKAYPRRVTLTDQAIGASVTAYITGSDIDVTGLSIGSWLKWVIRGTKTAAATAAMTFSNLWGPNGTTADTARGTTLPTGTQTAVADVFELELALIVRAIGATGNFHSQWEFQHALNATGFDNARSNILTQALSANFDMTVASLKAGIQLVTGVSHAITIQQVIAERFDP